MKLETELMRGAGPAAVLSLLESGEKYGYELVTLLESRSGGVLAMGQSTLYPLLYNLEAKGLLASSLKQADSGRQRKYYHLTDAGHKQLARHREELTHLTTALGKLGLVTGFVVRPSLA